MHEGIKKTEDAVTAKLDLMIERGRSVRAFWMRKVLPRYVAAQKSRFITENESQTGRWLAINTAYAKYKTVKYKSFPGGGRKLLIATGRMMQALILDNKNDIGVVATDESLVIALKTQDKFEYPKFVAMMRPIMSFTNDFKKEIKADLITYLKGGAV